MAIDRSKLDEFTLAYLECAIWASHDLGSHASIDMIHGGTLATMVSDCEDFQKGNEADLELYCNTGRTLGHAGHDFWLTRNRHGAGFWGRGLPENLGRRLTEASHAYGEFTLYHGEHDGKIYGGEG